MLHRVNLPGCVPQLERIVTFQREVLRAACENDYQLPLQENALKVLFGDDTGEWIWGKFWTQPNRRNGILPPKEKSNIHLRLERLIQYYQQNTQEGIDTLAAFDNDIQFASNLNNPTFRFFFPSLIEANRRLITPLMIAFYEELLKAGFIQAIHGEAFKLNRDKLIKSFWDENTSIKVCPACDRERSDVIEDKVFDDADHFLPKAKYPFLSLHPFNLFPLCIYCNRSIKGEKDMVDDQKDSPLINMFHPYNRTALEKLDLIVFRDQHGVSTLGEFTDLDGMPSRRMNSLNRVFKLNKRWVERLKIQKQNIIDNIIAEGSKLRRRGQQNLITVVELREILTYEKQRTIDKMGRKPGFVVQNSYLTCALNDNGEFQELYKCFAAI